MWVGSLFLLWIWYPSNSFPSANWSGWRIYARGLVNFSSYGALKCRDRNIFYTNLFSLWEPLSLTWIYFNRGGNQEIVCGLISCFRWVIKYIKNISSVCSPFCLCCPPETTCFWFWSMMQWFLKTGQRCAECIFSSEERGMWSTKEYLPDSFLCWLKATFPNAQMRLCQSLESFVHLIVNLCHC